MQNGLEDFSFESCPNRYFGGLNEYHQCMLEASTPSKEAPCLFDEVDYRKCPLYEFSQQQSK